jgi:hypothetical protein
MDDQGKPAKQDCLKDDVHKASVEATETVSNIIGKFFDSQAQLSNCASCPNIACEHISEYQYNYKVIKTGFPYPRHSSGRTDK